MLPFKLSYTFSYAIVIITGSAIIIKIINTSNWRVSLLFLTQVIPMLLYKLSNTFSYYIVIITGSAIIVKIINISNWRASLIYLI